LTFEDSFFVNLPEFYEPWLVEEDPVEGSNRGDNDDSIGLTPPDDDPAKTDPAKTEEDETFTTDVPAPMSPLPAAPTDRPSRTVIKPTRFRVTETTDDLPGQARLTPEINTEYLANQPEDTESTPQGSVETREEICIVATAPEIEIEFGDEPAIELSSYY